MYDFIGILMTLKEEATLTAFACNRLRLFRTPCDVAVAMESQRP